MRYSVWLLLVTLTASCPAGAQQPAPAVAGGLPVEQMRQTVEKAVDLLISRQRADGCWYYEYDLKEAYDVGSTALCTLALRHSGLNKAIVPAQRGMSFVTQRPPEPLTYTAGLMEMLLHEAGSGRYQRLVDAYALMLIHSQQEGASGRSGWSYPLVMPNTSGVWPKAGSSGYDNSNSQFGVLGLYFAQRAGFQVPLKSWQLVKSHYEGCQRADGGWGYVENSGTNAYPSTYSMSAAGTISLFLADEALQTQSGPHVCKMFPENPAVTKGMQYVGDKMPGDSGPYTWYALERLGILSGHSEFGGKDWLEAGAKALVRTNLEELARSDRNYPYLAFVALFLSRALEPVMFNKLQRAGDWNNDPYDMKHLTEFITEKYQNPRQWRIITLEAPVEHLLRVPVLYINGHDPLKFTAEEKAKLKEYVSKGGTIFGMACCGSKKFDKSFRELCSELWPDSPLAEVPKGHPLFQHPKKNLSPPTVFGVSLEQGQSRLGVVYSAKDLCCAWSVGGKPAEPSYALGVNLVFYLDVVASRQGAVKAGYGTVHTGGEAPGAAAPAPVQPQAQP